MSAAPALEARIQALESSLRRTRRGALGLGLVLTLITGAALVPQTTETTRMLLATPTQRVTAPQALPDQAQVADQVSAGRLILTDAAGAPAVVILAGPDASVVIQTPAGDEVLRLGGHPARRIVQ
jgi:hypothetical protein